MQDITNKLAQVMQDTQAKMGVAATSFGGASLYLELFTDLMGAVLVTVNAILATGGVIVIWPKVKNILKGDK